MTLEWTLGVLMAALAAFLIALWRSRRPYVPGRPPLLPLGAVQFIALLVAFVMIGHLISLLTGKPFGPRNGLY